MVFREGPIEGVLVRAFRQYQDDRGWVMEVFRHEDDPGNPFVLDEMARRGQAL